MKTTLKAALVALGIAGGAVVAAAQAGPGNGMGPGQGMGPGMGPGMPPPPPPRMEHRAPGDEFHHMMRHAARQLNLSDEQREQIRDIWKQHNKAIKDLARQLREGRRDFNKLLLTDSPDAAALQAKATAVGNTAAQLMLEVGKVRQEVRGKLTPEQKKIADGWKEGFYGRMEQGLMGPQHGMRPQHQGPGRQAPPPPPHADDDAQ